MSVNTTTDHDEELAALRYILEMTEMSDWHLLHDEVRRGVAVGEFSKAFESSYKEMVDELAGSRKEEGEGDV